MSGQRHGTLQNVVCDENGRYYPDDPVFDVVTATTLAITNLTTTNLTVTTDATIGDDLVVTDDVTVGGDLVVTGTITGQLNDLRMQNLAGENPPLTNSATASANGTIAMGNGASSTATRATAVGIASLGGATSGTALGDQAACTGVNGTCVGFQAIGAGADAVSVGSGSRGTAARTVAIGNGPVATGINTVCIGFGPTSTGQHSIGIGNATAANGDDAIGLGRLATTVAGGCMAIGPSSESGLGINDVDCIAIGRAARSHGSGVGEAVAIGRSAAAILQHNVAVGPRLEVNAAGASAFGSGNPAGLTTFSTANAFAIYSLGTLLMSRAASGVLFLPGLPAAPGASGSVYYDAGAANVLKFVP